MTITQLSDCRVLLSLCCDDMKSFQLSFDNIGFSDPHSKKILSRLLSLACTKTGLSTKNKTVLVEALENADGCIILISLSEKEKRKKYRIKHISEYPCYCFENSENLLCAIEKLYHSCAFFYNNSVYFHSGKYYLVFDYPVVSDKARKILLEYCNKVKGTKLFISRLNEYAKKLSGGNAIDHIGSAL